MIDPPVKAEVRADGEEAKLDEKIKDPRNYRKAWESTFIWLEFSLQNSSMRCKICSKHKLHTESNQFADEGSKNFRKSALLEHGCSQFHLECFERSVLSLNLEKIVRCINKRIEGLQKLKLIICYVLAREDMAIIKFEPLCNYFGFFL